MTYRGNSARSYNPITGEERVYVPHGDRPSDVPQIDLSDVPYEAPSYRSAKNVQVERKIESYQQILKKSNNQQQTTKPEPANNVKSKQQAEQTQRNQQPVAAAVPKAQPPVLQAQAYQKQKIPEQQFDIPRLSLDDENQSYRPAYDNERDESYNLPPKGNGVEEEYPHLRKEFDAHFTEYHYPYSNANFGRLLNEMDGHSKSVLGCNDADRNNLVEATLNEQLGKTTRVAPHGDLSSEERSAMRTVLKQTAGLNTARLNELQRTVTKKEMNEERVRFSARIVGADDRESLKELTGYYFPLDGSLIVYEFCSHLIGRSYTVGGKLDRTRQVEVLPFLKRFAYLQRSVNVAENTSELVPIGLLDVFVGNTLYIPVKDKESTDEKALGLRIVSVDQAKLESHVEKMYSNAMNAKLSKHERLLTLYYFRALSRNTLEDTLFYNQFQRSVIEEENSTTRLQTWALLQYVAKQSSGSAAQRTLSALPVINSVSLADLGVVLREMNINVLEADLHRFFMGLLARLQLLGFGTERCEVAKPPAQVPVRARTNSQQQATRLTQYVDKIDARILMRYLFGEMPEWRKTIVRRVFQRLDPRKTGAISLIETIKAFNPSSSLRPHYEEFLQAFTEYARTCARVAARLAPRTSRTSARADSIDINEVRVTFFEFELFYDSVSAARFGVSDATLDVEFVRFVNSCWQSIL